MGKLKIAFAAEISKDLFTATSNYDLTAGITHLSALEMIRQYKKSQEW